MTIAIWCSVPTCPDLADNCGDARAMTLRKGGTRHMAMPDDTPATKLAISLERCTHSSHAPPCS